MIGRPASGLQGSHEDAAARDRPRVQSVERSLDILEALLAGGPLPIIHLAKRTGLHASTVHRLLATLVKRGYVQQDRESSKYSLGPRAFQLGSGASSDSDLRTVAKPFLQRLMEATGETANLATVDEHEAVYIEQAEGKHLVRMFTKIGRRVPLHCTGVGKVFLAYMPDDRVDAIIAHRGLPAFTMKTITDRHALKADLHAVRAHGFAVDNEEQEEGVRCVAAPVYDRDWTVVAAISISAPVTRFAEDRIQALAARVRESAFAVSAQLGCNTAQPERGRSPKD